MIRNSGKHRILAPVACAEKDARQTSLSNGAVTLGNIVGKITMLEIACDRYDHRVWLRAAMMVEQHGADMGCPNSAVSSRATARAWSRHRFTSGAESSVRNLLR
jgi:hypothetical protein